MRLYKQLATIDLKAWFKTVMYATHCPWTTFLSLDSPEKVERLGWLQFCHLDYKLVWVSVIDVSDWLMIVP